MVGVVWLCGLKRARGREVGGFARRASPQLTPTADRAVWAHTSAPPHRNETTLASCLCLQSSHLYAHARMRKGVDRLGVRGWMMAAGGGGIRRVREKEKASGFCVLRRGLGSQNNNVGAQPAMQAGSGVRAVWW